MPAVHSERPSATQPKSSGLKTSLDARVDSVTATETRRPSLPFSCVTAASSDDGRSKEVAPDVHCCSLAVGAASGSTEQEIETRKSKTAGAARSALGALAGGGSSRSVSGGTPGREPKARGARTPGAGCTRARAGAGARAAGRGKAHSLTHAPACSTSPPVVLSSSAVLGGLLRCALLRVPPAFSRRA